MIEDKMTTKLNIDSIKNTILNFIVPLICLAISLILGFVVIYRHFQTYPAKKAELAEKEALKETLTTKVKKLSKLEDFKPMLDEDSNMVDRVLVSEANVPQLLDQINQIATNAGFEISRLNYSYGSVTSASEPSAPVLTGVDVALGANGSYDQLIVFLKETETAARVLSVSSFRFGVNEDDGRLSINFGISSPYLFVKSDAVTDDPVDIDITRDDFISFVNKLKSMRYYEFLNPGIAETYNVDVEEAEESTQSAD